MRHFILICFILTISCNAAHASAAMNVDEVDDGGRDKKRKRRRTKRKRQRTQVGHAATTATRGTKRKRQRNHDSTQEDSAPSPSKRHRDTGDTWNLGELDLPGADFDFLPLIPSPQNHCSNCPFYVLNIHTGWRSDGGGDANSDIGQRKADFVRLLGMWEADATRRLGILRQSPVYPMWYQYSGGNSGSVFQGPHAHVMADFDFVYTSLQRIENFVGDVSGEHIDKPNRHGYVLYQTKDNTPLAMSWVEPPSPGDDEDDVFYIQFLVTKPDNIQPREFHFVNGAFKILTPQERYGQTIQTDRFGIGGKPQKGGGSTLLTFLLGAAFGYTSPDLEPSTTLRLDSATIYSSKFYFRFGLQGSYEDSDDNVFPITGINQLAHAHEEGTVSFECDGRDSMERLIERHHEEAVQIFGREYYLHYDLHYIEPIPLHSI